METFTEGLDPAPSSPIEKTYSPLPDPAERPEPKTFGSDEGGLGKAADELSHLDEINRELTRIHEVPQESEGPITEREYSRNTGDGIERTDESKTITAERAARDLTEIRDLEVAQVDEALRDKAAQEIDAVRFALNGNQTAPDPVAAALQQSQAAPQVEKQLESAPQQTQPGIHPEIAKALENPVVRQALEETVAEVGKAQRQYAEMAASTAYAGLSAMLNQFPELRGLNGQQLDVAVQLIARQNPARATEIATHIGAVKQSYDQAIQAQQQIKQQQAAQYRQDWQNYVKQEDAALFKAAPELADQETQRKTADGMISVLRDVGFPDQDLKAALEGRASISLQDHRAQLLIRDAWRYRQAMRFEPVRNVPTVQRPGVSQPRGHGDDVRVSELSSRLNQTGDAKDAARLLIAKRARR